MQSSLKERKETEKNMRVQDFGEQTERIMSSAKMENSLNSKVSFTYPVSYIYIISGGFEKVLVVID